MILGYKKLFPWNKPTEFDRKIINGHKKHTIRVDEHDRWRTGRRINHCHGVRTKCFDNFYNNDCTGTQTIKIIDRNNGLKQHFSVYIDGRFFYNTTMRNDSDRALKMLELVHNDGFDCLADFFGWFNTDFTGKLIHWTDLRY